MRKRAISRFLAALISGLLSCSGTIIALSAAAEEAVLPVNTTVSGTLSGGEENDLYEVSLEKSGHFSVTLSLDQPDSSGAWQLTLLDAQKNTLQQWILYGSEGALETNPMGFRAGVYYLSIAPLGEQSCSYTLTVQYTAAKNSAEQFEAEYNDTIQTANTLSPGVSCTGNLCNLHDTDCFSFSPTETAAASVSFVQTTQSDTAGEWEIALQNDTGTILEQWSSADTQTYQTETILEADKTYFLQISSIVHSTDSYAIQLISPDDPGSDPSADPTDPSTDSADPTDPSTDPADPAESYLKGDADESGAVSTHDAYVVLLSSAMQAAKLEGGQLEGNAFLAGDVNEDGKLTTIDAYYILLYYATDRAGYTADWDAILP